MKLCKHFPENVTLPVGSGYKCANCSDDMVQHPPHYTSHPSGVEAIEVTRHMNFNLGNAMKYLWRAGLKDPSKTIEDLQKAVFYIQDEIKRLEGQK
jgi:hypothetical protein